jgi:hypothetical protein
MAPLLLILDLDETLIFGTEAPIDRPADLRVAGYMIYHRPHLAEFIAQVRAAYRLAVWTSATESYAVPIARSIFPAGPVAGLCLEPRALHLAPQPGDAGGVLAQEPTEG